MITLAYIIIWLVDKAIAYIVGGLIGLLIGLILLPFRCIRHIFSKFKNKKSYKKEK